MAEHSLLRHFFIQNAFHQRRCDGADVIRFADASIAHGADSAEPQFGFQLIAA